MNAAVLHPDANWVLDKADVLPAATERRLTERLAALEKETTDQLVVVTVPDLQGRTIETWGRTLGNEWGVGQRGIDNGVLLIVAPADHKVRIQVGYGLEGLLTDERAQQIIDRALVPRFRQGDLSGGIEQGVTEVIDTLRSVRERPMRKQAKAA